MAQYISLTKAKIYWALSGLWIVFIYSTLYYVRSISNFIKQFSCFVFLTDLMVIVPLAVVGYIFYRMKLQLWSSWFLFIMMIAIYGYGMWIIEYADEKIHFLEYGVLAVLLFKALLESMKAINAYIFSWVLVSLAGLGDELIQGILPNRRYDMNDVILNSVSGLLGLILIFIVERDRLLTTKAGK